MLLSSGFMLIVSVYKIGKHWYIVLYFRVCSFLFKLLKSEKRKNNLFCSQKCCLKAHLFFPFLYINNIEQKWLEIKSNKYLMS